MNRIPFNFNMPSFYHIEKHNWDLYHCGVLRDYDIPAASLSFNLPHVMKVSRVISVLDLNVWCSRGTGGRRGLSRRGSGWLLVMPWSVVRI